MTRRTLTVLRILAAAVVAAVIIPSVMVSGCGGGNVKGGTAADAGNAPAPAHVTAADAKGDAGHAAAANSAAGAADAGVAIEEAAPPIDAVDLNLRGRHLLEAIAHGEPKLAADIVYPRDAYIATHDNTDAGKQWDKKAYPLFERDVNTMRKRMHLLHLPEQVQFLSFELGPSVVQAPVKKRDLKVPVWRVRHSKLSFAIGGKNQRIEIAEMTAWHGAWYVSKLR